VSRTNTGSDDGSGSDDIPSIARRVIAPFVDRSVAERLLISVAAILLSIIVGFAIVLVSGRVAQCSTAAWTMPLTGIGFCYDPVEVYLVLFNGALGYPFAVGVSRGSSTQPGRRSTSRSG